MNDKTHTTPPAAPLDGHTPLGDEIDRLTGERDRQYEQNAEQIVRIARAEAQVAELREALRDIVDLAEYCGKSQAYQACAYNLLLGTLPKIRAALARTEGGRNV